MASSLSATDKSANVTLSGGDLTMSMSSASQGGVRGTEGKSSLAGGKYYFEVAIGQQTYVDYKVAVAVGVSGQAHLVSKNPGSDTPGTGYMVNWQSGARWAYDYKDSSGGATSGQTAVVTADVLGVLVDFDNMLLKTTLNGGAEVTGLGFSLATFYPHIVATSTGDGVTVNFGGTTFVYSIPAGYAPWDTPPVAQRARLVQNNRPLHFIGL